MKRRFDLRRIAGYSAVVLAGLYPTGVVLLPAIFGEGSADFLLSPGVLVSYWGGVATLATTFVVESFEKVETAEAVILAREFQGIETFYNADTFVERLSDITVGSESIATLNFSPPAGSSAALDRYFERLHAYVSSNDPRLKSFRSIASIESRQKADWIVERSARFVGNSHVSFSCFREQSALRLMCYHVVMKDGVGYVFFYPPVPLTGVMSAFLMVNTKVALLMKEQFDLAWAKSVPVLLGGRARCDGLELLRERGAASDTKLFATLRATAGSEEY